MEEIWKQIDGYDYYQVSNLGNVWSCKRGHNLKGRVVRGGYLSVSLTKNGKEIDHLVHRLVAIAFIPNPENKPQVDHIFNVVTDNRAEVLRWATNQENQRNRPLSSRNTSGTKGVIWYNPTQKWSAFITINMKRYSLGYFDSKEDAIVARQTRANEVFGVFTNLCENLSPPP